MAFSTVISILGAAASLVIAGSASRAAPIDGVWADNASHCSKIFIKTGKTISLAPDADFYGSGFIIQGNNIVGKFLTCKIKSRAIEGDVMRLAADCSSVITTQAQQFTLKLLGNDRIIRMFPDIPEMAVTYDRCRL
jgi:hypothetical protein